MVLYSQVDPTTGEAEDDGVEDEYQLEDLEVAAADYVLKVGVSNFRNAWESMGPEYDRVDEYGLGPRESLAEAVSAVISLLGLQPCEVSLSVGIIPIAFCMLTTLLTAQTWKHRLNLVHLEAIQSLKDNLASK